MNPAQLRRQLENALRMADDIVWYYVEDDDYTLSGTVDAAWYDAVREAMAAVPEATWTLNTAIAGNCGGGIVALPDQVSYNPGQALTLRAEPATGAYLFTWEGDASGAMPSVAVVMERDLSLTARFAPRPAPGPQLLLNPGFEAGLEAWGDWGSSGLTASAHNGSAALFVGSAEGGRIQDVVVGPGRYLLFAWSLAALTTDSLSLGMYAFNAAGDVIGQASIVLPQTSTWEWRAFALQAPAGTVLLRSWFYKGGTVSEVQLDDWHLSAWQAGDVTGDAQVDAADTSLLREQFGRSANDQGWDMRADLDGDGRVGATDLMEELRRQGR